MSLFFDVLFKEGVYFNLFFNWKCVVEVKKLGEILIFIGL